MISEETVIETPAPSKKEKKKAKKEKALKLGSLNVNSLKAELKKIGNAFQQLVDGGLKPEFAVALIHDVTRIKKKQVRQILETASKLEQLFVVPTTKKAVSRKKTVKKKTSKKTK